MIVKVVKYDPAIGKTYFAPTMGGTIQLILVKAVILSGETIQNTLQEFAVNVVVIVCQPGPGQYANTVFFAKVKHKWRPQNL